MERIENIEIEVEEAVPVQENNLEEEKKEGEPLPEIEVSGEDTEEGSPPEVNPDDFEAYTPQRTEVEGVEVAEEWVSVEENREDNPADEDRGTPERETPENAPVKETEEEGKTEAVSIEAPVQERESNAGKRGEETTPSEGEKGRDWKSIVKTASIVMAGTAVVAGIGLVGYLYFFGGKSESEISNLQPYTAQAPQTPYPNTQKNRQEAGTTVSKESTENSQSSSAAEVAERPPKVEVQTPSYASFQQTPQQTSEAGESPVQVRTAQTVQNPQPRLQQPQVSKPEKSPVSSEKPAEGVDVVVGLDENLALLKKRIELKKLLVQEKQAELKLKELEKKEREVSFAIAPPQFRNSPETAKVNRELSQIKVEIEGLKRQISSLSHAPSVPPPEVEFGEVKVIAVSCNQTKCTALVKTENGYLRISEGDSLGPYEVAEISPKGVLISAYGVKKFYPVSPVEAEGEGESSSGEGGI